MRQKKLRLEEQKRKARDISLKMVEGEGNQRRTVRNFITLGVHDIISSIARPTGEAYNFKLNLALISMVQQAQARGNPMEYPNLHLSVFLEVYDTLKLNEVSTNAI